MMVVAVGERNYGQLGFDGEVVEELTEAQVGYITEKLSAPFAHKFAHTRALIAKTLLDYPGTTTVSCSFGKDSLVVAHIVTSFIPDVPVVFCNTGVEHPQTLRFSKEITEAWGLNLTVTRPSVNYWQCVAKNGFAPGSKNTSAGKQCCYRLKERPMELAIREHSWKAVIEGTTAAESRQRTLRAVSHGDCFHHIDWDIQKVKPILWWTVADVWRYIELMGLPVNPLYLEGSRRVGCMTCTAYKRWEIEMSLLTPKLYRIITSRISHERQMALFGWTNS